MKTTSILALTTILAAAGAAHAGGVERSITSIGLLFEKGNYAELSFGSVSPDVSGTQSVPLIVPAGGNSGNMAENYTQYSLGVKMALNDHLHLAVIMDQPIGAKVNYSDPNYAYGLAGGSQAEIKSSALTALLRYDLQNGFSVYGGIKGEKASGKVKLFNGYTMSTSSETDYGFLVGAAYEKPEIALRVALTYHSPITHNFSVTENGSPSLPFETEVPKYIALDFQSGVAKDTLVFGSIRWREWSAFDITPFGYYMATGDSLVSYDNDVFTYNLGVGRRINENWAAAVSVTHEASQGGFAGNLGPTDGFTSLTVGATYTKDNMKISGGVSYAWIGDAKTEAPAPYPDGTTFGDFTGNTTLGVGVRVGFTF